jgi:hypothetical protein
VERHRKGEGEQERKIQARIYKIGMVVGYGMSRYIWKDVQSAQKKTQHIKWLLVAFPFTESKKTKSFSETTPKNEQIRLFLHISRINNQNVSQFLTKKSNLKLTQKIRFFRVKIVIYCTGCIKDMSFLFAFCKKSLISLFFHLDSENDFIYPIWRKTKLTKPDST